MVRSTPPAPNPYADDIGAARVCVRLGEDPARARRGQGAFEEEEPMPPFARRPGRGTLVLLTLAAAAPVAPGDAAAQWVIEPAAGVDLPLGNLSDLVNPGPMFDALVGYRITERIFTGVRGSLSLLGGAESPLTGRFPDVDLWRAMAEIAANALAPGSDWALWIGGGIGAAVFAPATGTSTSDFSATLYADLLHQVTRDIGIGGGVRGYMFWQNGTTLISLPIEVKALIGL